MSEPHHGQVQSKSASSRPQAAAARRAAAHGPGTWRSGHSRATLNLRAQPAPRRGGRRPGASPGDLERRWGAEWLRLLPDSGRASSGLRRPLEYALLAGKLAWSPTVTPFRSSTPFVSLRLYIAV